MALEGTAKDIAKGLIPPRDADPDHVYRYRVTVSLVLIGVLMGLSLHIAWACGYLAAFGLSGFAHADEVAAQRAQLTSIQTSQIVRDIRDVKKQVCLAQQARNQPALTSWSATLDGLRDQYYALTHTAPYVMSCDELLISGAPPS